MMSFHRKKMRRRMMLNSKVQNSTHLYQLNKVKVKSAELKGLLLPQKHLYTVIVWSIKRQRHQDKLQIKLLQIKTWKFRDDHHLEKVVTYLLQVEFRQGVRKLLKLKRSAERKRNNRYLQGWLMTNAKGYKWKRS